MGTPIPYRNVSNRVRPSGDITTHVAGWIRMSTTAVITQRLRTKAAYFGDRNKMVSVKILSVKMHPVKAVPDNFGQNPEPRLKARN